MFERFKPQAFRPCFEQRHLARWRLHLSALLLKPFNDLLEKNGEVRGGSWDFQQWKWWCFQQKSWNFLRFRAVKAGIKVAKTVIKLAKIRFQQQKTLGMITYMALYSDATSLLPAPSVDTMPSRLPRSFSQGFASPPSQLGSWSSKHFAFLELMSTSAQQCPKNQVVIIRKRPTRLWFVGGLRNDPWELQRKQPEPNGFIYTNQKRYFTCLWAQLQLRAESHAIGVNNPVAIPL